MGEASMTNTKSSKAESKMNSDTLLRPKILRDGSKTTLSLLLESPGTFLELNQQIQDMRVLALDLPEELRQGVMVDILIEVSEIGEVIVPARLIYQMGANSAFVPDLNIPAYRSIWETMLKICKTAVEINESRGPENV